MMFPLANILSVSGSQNILFPSEPVNKCLLLKILQPALRGQDYKQL